MMTPIFSLANVHRQYFVCRRNKRNTLNALRFEYNLEENLIKLQEELQGQTYAPSRSVCFVLKQPKLREIFAADFRDGVVHRILVAYLEKVWEPVFIHDSYACRKGKGTHKAVKRLQGFMRRVSHNGTRKAYFMHLDIRGFFLHINKEILYRIIAKRIKDERVLWLARRVIFNDCTQNFVLKGKKALLERIPSHKTLFNTENKRGLPIGNLTSQFFSNVYLNELDQFVKHRLKAGYYLRYSDDFVLLHEEKERLLGWRGEIEEFLQTRLRLTLNDRCRSPGPISNGVDFLGYIVRSGYLLVRRRVVNRLKARLVGYEKMLVRREEDCTVLKYDHAMLEKLMATLASYLAHLKMANSYALRQKLLARFGWLEQFFAWQGGKLKGFDQAPGWIHNLKGQYRFFLQKCSGSILFVRVGRFYELYDQQADLALRVFGLRRIVARRSFRTRCGFPCRLKEIYVRKFMNLGLSVCVVNEGDSWVSRIKKRYIAERWIPMQ